MTNTNSQRSIALALGGGGARGIAHIHVLKAFDDLGIKPVEISGSSIGAIVGAGYASGMSGSQIEDYFVSSFSNSSSVLAKLWKLRPDSIKSIVNRQNGGAFGQMDIERVLDVFLPENIPATFEELKIPLTVTGTDFYGNALKILKTGDLEKSIAASAAIPVVFKPVKIDGCILIDGGINNPLPFDLLDATKNLVVAVDVVGLPKGEAGTMPGRIDAGFGASQLMMQSITNLKLQISPPDLFVRPSADDFRVLDFLKVKEIIKATKDTYDETKRGIERLIENSHSSISA